jgi:hypothetical protein
LSHGVALLSQCVTRVCCRISLYGIKSAACGGAAWSGSPAGAAGPATTLRAALRAVLSRARPDGAPALARCAPASRRRVPNVWSFHRQPESPRHITDARQHARLCRALGRRGDGVGLRVERKPHRGSGLACPGAPTTTTRAEGSPAYTANGSPCPTNPQVVLGSPGWPRQRRSPSTPPHLPSLVGFITILCSAARLLLSTFGAQRSWNQIRVWGSALVRARRR